MSYNKPISKKIVRPKKYTSHTTPTCFSFSISIPGLCVIIFISIMALSWSFVFGVLIGRGYSPNHDLYEINQIINDTSSEKQIEKQSTLKPENLHFMHELKQNNNTTLYNKEEKKIHNLSQEIDTNLQRGQIHSSHPHLKQQDISSERKNIQKNINIKEQVKQIKSKNDLMIYSFVFQVASFKKKIQAESLREKLEEEGFRTQLVTTSDEKGNIRWYHVRVLLRGVKSDAIIAKDTFTQLKLKDTKIISQEPTGRYR